MTKLDVAFPTFVKTRQGYQYQALHDFNGKRLRATVYRDSYDFQSWAKIEVWSNLEDQWNTVVSRRGEQIDTLPSPHTRDLVDARVDCENLVSAMMAEARFTLGA
jgi:hypothetical protein